MKFISGTQYVIIVFFTLLLSFNVGAQESNWTLYPENKKSLQNINEKPKVSSFKNNSIEIVADNRINQILEKEIRIAEEKGTIPGFRIQIYYGSGPGSKTTAKEIQGEFLKSYPTVSSYLIFQSPNFKIRVGDFKSKLEAQKFLLDCKSVFNNAFIVKDEINIASLD